MAALDWIEAARGENLNGRRENFNFLTKEGARTFKILFVTATALLSFALKNSAGSVDVIRLGSIVVAAHLYLVCGYMVRRVLDAIAVPAIYNEPKNLMYRGHSRCELQIAELDAIKRRIIKATKLNRERARFVRRARVAAMCSPLISGWHRLSAIAKD
ncbi:hypothetical protein [Bordetella sp. 02P26C-1]|uniref:hypothetical protein n=1 Tax=Bordetella sp. 02P26C-1 TaxID=2683195 RepID=UPI001355247B|nr:hypothetical protein [Bordetella sp. 02P26C-1]MVW80160.1 hypothetical protein [Bordetella sp. 02P26C-1]